MYTLRNVPFLFLSLHVFLFVLFFFVKFFRRKILEQQNAARIAANQAALNQTGGLAHMPGGMSTPTSGPRGLGSMSPAPQVSRPRKLFFYGHYMYIAYIS